MNCKINYWERDVSRAAANHCEDQSVVMWPQAVAAVVWSIGLEQEKSWDMQSVTSCLTMWSWPELVGLKSASKFLPLLKSDTWKTDREPPQLLPVILGLYFPNFIIQRNL